MPRQANAVVEGGTRMVEKALKENGERMDPFTKKVFEQNMRTHNECVFDLYTTEMRLVRSAHALTGLPDSYGRGRLIGDYRRVALYGFWGRFEKYGLSDRGATFPS